MGFQMENEEINDLAKQIIEETRIVDNVPARVNLRAYHTVGIIGERSRVVGQIWNMLVALMLTASKRISNFATSQASKAVAML